MRTIYWSAGILLLAFAIPLAAETIWNHFDVVRIENNLIKEHWDEARIDAPAPRP